MDISEEQKQKILWVRSLLKKNAPFVYYKFANSKLHSYEPTKATAPNGTGDKPV